MPRRIPLRRIPGGVECGKSASVKCRAFACRGSVYPIYGDFLPLDTLFGAAGATPAVTLIYFKQSGSDATSSNRAKCAGRPSGLKEQCRWAPGNCHLETSGVGPVG